MNALPLVIVGLCVLSLGYRFYSAFLAAKVATLDDTRVTPACRLGDGSDYVPMNRWVVFGHHFAAIAGPGPLVGPVLAAQFGYLPGVIWILIGSVFAGAVHDMVILFAAVRRDGLSLSRIARSEMGPATGVSAALAIISIVILSLAVLSKVFINALAGSPWATFTILMTIPIGVLMGLAMRHGEKQMGIISLAGVLALVTAVAVGPWVQNTPWISHLLSLNEHELTIVLGIYAFIASVLPVWLLLAPRDYLSTYMKLGTILLLAIGVIVVNPHLHMPAVTQFAWTKSGPVIPGPVWPFVCITIACGACSGFHSLISSGTTPKMLRCESDIRLIGYGAMVTEGFVALLALIAACSLKPGDYFAMNAGAVSKAVMAYMAAHHAHILAAGDLAPDLAVRVQGIVHMTGWNVTDLSWLSTTVKEQLAGRSGGAVTLAVGMAYIFSRVPFMSGLLAYWYHFALLFEAVFILTTIDAGTRVARYAVEELVLNRVDSDSRAVRRIVGPIVTLGICLAWGAMVWSGSIMTLWPMFGVANQLLAALALGVGTTVLLGQHPKKPAYALTTALPFSFMLVTTTAAAYWNVFNAYVPQLARPETSGMAMWDIGVTVFLWVLVVVVASSCVAKWVRLLRRR